MTNVLPASKSILIEAQKLAEQILNDIENNTLPLANIALKTTKLARLLNDFENHQIMIYETGGYPVEENNKVSSDIWRLGEIANRIIIQEGPKKQILKSMYLESIAEIENEVSMYESNIAAAKDPSASISSSNPQQFVFPHTNLYERNRIRNEFKKKSKRISERRSFLYKYVLEKYLELNYSAVSADIFNAVRSRVDLSIGKILPDAINQFTAIYNNLKSENTEDWSNAVHGCRRILQSLADKLYPATKDKEFVIAGINKVVKLGKENYINRLIAFACDNSNSKTFKEIVGSELHFLGDRLDSIYSSATKGSHSNITSMEEANRCVIHTYLLVGDLLTLSNEIKPDNGS